ncbi:type II toxin-antitoxin system antitoxin SocA domain-containing protein [Candidatus Parabeggiatoa sp. HSG14]|uniref:Panacea domain-containing protein n=1 Tax=Candidatus Parabeggiatoa sp. HSG14 TaxID=3055593 RepID=UPI0025A8E8F5|nr:DUF4065 domain-containing protein [Thiotrichales bacterium HSG14]
MAITTASKIADYFLYIANDTGSFLSNLKLQKLVYYAQAWYLALYNTPLFDEEFEAWIHGPITTSLYEKYKPFGWKPILKEVEKPKLPVDVENFLEELTQVYFIRESLELEMMIHREEPWIKARNGVPLDEPSRAIISQQAMKEYYKARVA